MQISGAVPQAVQAAAAQQTHDIADLTKLAVAVDVAHTSTGAAVAALPDPDSSKGASVDTYA